MIRIGPDLRAQTLTLETLDWAAGVLEESPERHKDVARVCRDEANRARLLIAQGLIETPVPAPGFKGFET